MTRIYRRITSYKLTKIKEALVRDEGRYITDTLLQIHTVLGNVMATFSHEGGKLEVEVWEKPFQVSHKAFFKDLDERISRIL